MFAGKKKIWLGAVTFLLGGIMAIVHQYDKRVVEADESMLVDENKPIIECITPSSVLMDTKFNDDNRIVIEGPDLSSVIGVYVDGIYIKEYVFDAESSRKRYKHSN